MREQNVTDESMGSVGRILGDCEPLIPSTDELRKTSTQSYQRKFGVGRKRKYDDRTYFSAIVYVLHTGIIWNAFPREKSGGLGPSVLHN